MIKPTKYTNINLSVIGISYEILRILKDEPSQKYNYILDRLVIRKGPEAKENFLLSLNFLYLLGKIKYHSNEDVIELLI